MIAINSDNPNSGSNLFFLTILLVMLLVLGATKCKAQVERTHRYDDAPGIVTKFPQKPLFFGEDGCEPIALNICVDSVSITKQRIILFAFYPGQIGKQLILGLETGEMLNLDPYKVDGNYVEYMVDLQTFSKLRAYRIDYVDFVGVAQCIDIHEKSFFRNFLTRL